jgi:hypothetical protein
MSLLNRNLWAIVDSGFVAEATVCVCVCVVNESCGLFEKKKWGGKCCNVVSRAYEISRDFQSATWIVLV